MNKLYMEKYGHYLVRVLILFMLAMILIGCSPINAWLGLSDDNLAEEAIEFVIQEELGISVDLTPASEE